MTTTSPQTIAPLRGVTLIEIADAPGARYCGRLFATLGAMVVRVAGAADALPGAAGAAAFSDWLDEDKRVAPSFDAALEALDGSPDIVLAGQAREQIAAADALIAQANLDTLRLGLTWFGDVGPYADWRGDDGLIQALVGVAAAFGEPDEEPMMPQGRAPQIMAGAMLFVAGLATLWGRRSGRGDRRVDVNVLEAALAFTETSPPSFDKTDGRAGRSGVNRFPANHPTTVYPTKDGWLGVTTLTPAQWKAMAELVGRPAWGDDPRFATSAARVANAHLIDDALTQILPGRTTAEWLLAGQQARIPLAPVPRHVDLLETEHWLARESFRPLPGWPAVKAPGLPFRMRVDAHRRPRPLEAGDAPLSGLRVIDFSMGWAGPLCTRQLADFGADVIKIESETHYDWWRGWEPVGAADPPAYELMPVFNIMNRGKRGVSLDLTTPQGVAHAKALIADADLVIENYAPGVMAKLGLDAEALQAVRPGLVMVSMGAFGAAGPWRFFRAYGSTVEHASGMPHTNGRAAWPPCLQHGAYGDPVAGVYAAVAALAALHGREELGGAWIDLAQVECLFQLGADEIIAAQLDGDPPRLGNGNPHVAPRTVVLSADPEQALAVVAVDDDAWRSLARVLGREDWLQQPDLSTPAGRNAHSDEIDQALAAWASERPAADAAQILQARGVPAAPVVASHALTDDPHQVAAGAWMRIARRHVGLHLMAAPPYRVDGQRPPVRRPSPLLGEHSAEILADLETA